MQYQLKTIYQLTPSQIEDLHALYKNEWWTKHRTLQQTQQGVAGSQVCIGLIDANNRLKGFVRVITDFTFKALIFDLIIDNEYRSKGYAQKLIELIKAHDKLKHVLHFELYCLPELVDFYRQYGFSAEIDGITLLRYKNYQPAERQ